MNVLWTEREMEIVTQVFPMSGVKRTQQKLHAAGFHRTLHAIRTRATQLGLRLGKPDGFITLKELEKCTGLGYKHVKVKAAKAGVLKRFKKATSVAAFVVPEEWAFNEADKLVERRNVGELQWYSSGVVARKFGRSVGFVSDSVRDRVSHSWLRQRLRLVERRRGPRHHWHWNPREVDALVGEWNDRHKTRLRPQERTEHTETRLVGSHAWKGVHYQGSQWKGVGRSEARAKGLGGRASD